jgi:hypothetical protein
MKDSSPRTEGLSSREVNRSSARMAGDRPLEE